MNRKSIIAIIVIGILALAIPLTIRLVQQQQILKSRALTSGSGSFSEDFNGAMEGGNCEQRPSGWNVWDGDAGGNACLAGESGTKVSGNSQKILPAGEASLDQPKGGMWTNVVVTPGATYRLTGWSKRPFDRSLDFVGFELCNQNSCLSKDWRKLFLKHGPGDFYNFTEEFTASGLPLEGFLDLHVFIAAGLNPCCEGPGDVYFDDLSFGPTSGGTAPPSTPPASPDPIGSLDIATCERIEGWSCDASDFSQNVTVHLYDGPYAGSGANKIGEAVASGARLDDSAAVAARCGTNGSRKFTLTTPNSLKNGQPHHIYAYGINIPAGNNPRLNDYGDPEIITCTAVPPTTTQCFIITETQATRDGLLSCGQTGAIPYTQHPQTVSPFTLSVTNGNKTLYVRFIKYSGTPPATCSDSWCVNSQYQINLNVSQAISCTRAWPDGLTDDVPEIIGTTAYDAYKTNDSTGKNTLTKLNVNTNPTGVGVTGSSVPPLNFVRRSTEPLNHYIESIPANTGSAPSEYRISTAVALGTNTGQCTDFFIRVPAQTTGTCGCSSVVVDQGTCSSSCTFTRLTNVTYANPIKCSLASNIPITTPTADNKNSWCNNRVKRTLGDADGNGTVDATDYTYYLRAVLLGKIPPSVNSDFDGDGVIGTPDLTIWQQGRGQ